MFQTNNLLTTAPVIAAFDFDGTISYGDTLLPFIRFCYGSLQLATALTATIPTAFGFAVGLRSRVELKESLLTHSFRGETMEQLRRWGETFASGPLDRHLRASSLERLRWHQQQGHGCLLISANLGSYLRPWAMSLGFDGALCSELAVDADGLITGKLDGANCWGEEKTRRLFALLAPRPRHSYTLYAYGDSRGDQQLLAAADHPCYRWKQS